MLQNVVTNKWACFPWKVLYSNLIYFGNPEKKLLRDKHASLFSSSVSDKKRFYSIALTQNATLQEVKMFQQQQEDTNFWKFSIQLKN